MAVAQRPFTEAAFAAPSEPIAWKSVPSWYLLGTEDKAIPSATQRFMAERAEATIEELPASHASMVCRQQRRHLPALAGARPRHRPPRLRDHLPAVDGGSPSGRRVVDVVRRRAGRALRRLRPLMRVPDDPTGVGWVYHPSDGTGDAARDCRPSWPDGHAGGARLPT
jgi:hypothetical protein